MHVEFPWELLNQKGGEDTVQALEAEAVCYTYALHIYVTGAVYVTGANMCCGCCVRHRGYLRYIGAMELSTLHTLHTSQALSTLHSPYFMSKERFFDYMSRFYVEKTFARFFFERAPPCGSRSSSSILNPEF